MASVCRTVFVEPPIATSSANALSMLFSVMRSFGSGPPALAISTARRAAALQSSLRSGATAGIVPLPGSARPIASQRQFIELAVNMPEQEPQPGQEFCSMRSRPASSSLPTL